MEGGREQEKGGGMLGGGVMRTCYVSGLMLVRVVSVAG